MLLLLISTLIPKGPLFQAIKYDRLAPEFILPFSKKIAMTSKSPSEKRLSDWAGVFKAFGRFTLVHDGPE